MFGTLGRNGISVIAFAQGAKETNISFVVPQQQLSKTMNVLHDSFFLSENKVVNVFVCGTGTVGAQLIEQIKNQRDTLIAQQHLQLNVVGIANSRTAIFDADGLDLENYREQLQQAEKASSHFSVQQAAMQMAAAGVKEKVIIHSKPMGFCLDVKTGAFTYVPSLKIPGEVIKGSVGAGDAFCAGSLYGIYTGMSDGEILEFASAAAACNLFAENSVDGMQDAAGVREMMTRFPRQ